MAVDNQLFDKQPPYREEAEQAVLGAVLRENDRLPEITEVILQPDMFYLKSHRLIWRAMAGLYSKAEPIDLLTLQEVLRSEGQLEGVGGVSYLSKLIDSTPTAGNAVHYANIVQQQAVLRGILKMGYEFVSKSTEASSDPESLLDNALKALVEMRQQADPGGLESVDRVLVDVFRDMEGGQRGLPTGFPSLDRIVAGLEPGNFIVLAGRPSLGKTALAVSLVRHLALHRKEPVGVAYFYLEANRKDIGCRLLAGEADVSLADLKRGRLGKGDQEKLWETAKRISNGAIHIDDTPGLTATQIRGRTWQLKTRMDNLGIVVVDHIGRMGVEDRRLGRERQVAETSAFLSDMAKKLGVVVLALSQLNRECESRADKKPQLSDLRESGALEQDADLVLLLHRPGHYVDLRKKYSQTDATIIVAKQRDGPTGEVKLRFNPGPCRFEETL